MDKKPIIVCPKCAQKLAVHSRAGTNHVTCSRCQALWDWLPGADSIQEAIPRSNEGTPETTITAGVESIRKGNSTSSEGAPYTKEGLTFSCTSCQQPICIPNPAPSLIHRTITVLEDLPPNGIPSQGQCLICPQCGADFMVLSADQLREYLQQIASWHVAINSIHPSQALGIEPSFIIPRLRLSVSSAPFSLSGLTYFGRLLSLLSVAASVVVGLFIVLFFIKVAPKEGYHTGMVRVILLLTTFLLSFVGVMVFFAGKWLLEKKLNIVVIKEVTSLEEELRYKHYAKVLVAGLVVLIAICWAVYQCYFAE